MLHLRCRRVVRFLCTFLLVAVVGSASPQPAAADSPDLTGALLWMGRPCQVPSPDCYLIVFLLLILNRGSDPVSTPFTVQVFTSQDRVLDESDPLIDSFQISTPIPPKSGLLFVGATALLTQLPPWFLALLDADNVIPEARETNNVVVGHQLKQWIP